MQPPLPFRHSYTQGELFPSSRDLWLEVDADLERLDAPAALRRIEHAGEILGPAPELDWMLAAARWLDAAGLGPRPSADTLVETLREANAWARAGELPSPAAACLERALARHLLRPFASARELPARLGDTRPLPTARVLLLIGEHRRAEAALRDVLAIDPDAADLWLAQADLWHRQGHADAALAYGRALVLDPIALEPRWLASDPLRDLLARACEPGDPQAAPHRLLAEAWLSGHVTLPEGSPWSLRRIDPLRAEASRLPDTPAGRARRFALLLHEDRALGDADVERRDAMQALDPPLFSRVITRIRAHESERRLPY